MVTTDAAPLKRYWVSWWSRGTRKHGCKKLPFPHYVSGYRYRDGVGRCNDRSICCLLEAVSVEAIQEMIAHYHPDWEERFIEERTNDYVPGDRFPDAQVYVVRPIKARKKRINGAG